MADLPVYLTREEAHKLIGCGRTEEERLFLELLWQSGARISEALELRPRDVQERALAMRNLKQRKFNKLEKRWEHAVKLKLVHVSETLCAELKSFAARSAIGDQERIFAFSRVTGWRYVKHAAAEAGVVKVHGDRLTTAWPHALRHGCAVNLLLQEERPWPLPAVQQHLGHARIQTTTIYTQLASSDLDRLAETTEF